jgi:hypothetical protein
MHSINTTQHRVGRVATKLFLQSSEWGLRHPLTRGLGRGGGTHSLVGDARGVPISTRRHHATQCCGPGLWLDPASGNEPDPALIKVFLEQTFKLFFKDYLQRSSNKNMF